MQRRTSSLLIAVSAGVLVSASAADAALLSTNGTFDAGLSGWTTTGDVQVVNSDTFQGLQIDRPGGAPFARLGIGGGLAQTVDLTGATSISIAFDYRVAAWDVGAGSGSSAPGFSPSQARPLEIRAFAGGVTPLAPIATASFDEPWDGTCSSPPNLPLPTCTDGTPSESGWRHFSQTFTAPAVAFVPGTEIQMFVGPMFWPNMPFMFDEHVAIYVDDVSFTTSVPEPFTTSLLLMGLAGLTMHRRRRV